MAVALPVLIMTLIIQLAIGSLIGAVILRAACSLFNKWFGSSEPVVVEKPGANKPISATQSDSPYAAPMAPLKQTKASQLLEPEFGKAYLICLVASLVNAVLGFMGGLAVGLAYHGEPPNELVIALQVCVVGLGLFVLAIAIKVGLPTSFPKSLAVSGLFLLISLVVALAIGLIVFAMTSLFA